MAVKFTIWLTVLGVLVLPAYAAPDSNHPRLAAGHILVKPKAGLSEEKLNAILVRSGGAARGIQRKLDKLGIEMLSVPRGREEAFVEKFRGQKEFEFAEPDFLVGPQEVIPNDPRYGNQWHLPLMGGPSAWEESTGDGVVVAILDTGVYADHPDLADKMLPGRNIPSGNANTADVMGHGTAVAGSVAATGNNGDGIASVAYDAHILPVRISDRSDGLASFSDMAAGIIWATDNGAKVVNLSYRAAHSATIQSAARYLRNNGGLLFSAAGNDGIDPGWSNQVDVIVVSATDRNDVLTGFSNYGSYIDISAPGDYIYSTAKSGGYSNWRGTSFASPVAAGVAALIMSRRPELDPGEVFGIMAETAADKDAAGWDPQYGAGRVDAGAALAAAARQPSADTTDPTAVIRNPADGASVGGLVPISVSADDNQTLVAVDLFVDSLPIATDFDPPYEFIWDSAKTTAGAHTILAQARDAAGNTGDSEVVHVGIEAGDIDESGPEIIITSPRDGQTVSGTVSVSAYATDENGVQQVIVNVNDKMLCAGAPSVSCGWNTRKMTAGNYTITATAKDSNGNTSSSLRSVTVGKSGGAKGGRRGKGGAKKK